MRRPVRLLVAPFLLAPFVIDMVHPQPPSGVLVVVAMFGVIVALWRRAEPAGKALSVRARIAHLPRLRLALLLLMAGLAVARASVVPLPWLRPALDLEAARWASRLYVSLFALAGLMALTVNLFALRVGLTVVRLSHRPALLLVGSFALLIGVASMLLILPFAVYRMADVSLLDSIFTATSAVCVTGLVVNDVAQTYTLFGQIVILVAIQLGGIGMMTLAAFALGTGGTLWEQSRYCQMLAVRSLGDLRSLVRSVVVYTLVIEAAGSILLALIWRGDPRLGGSSSLWMAAFHAISAFCNAGFSLFSTSLVAFRGDLAANLVLMVLVFLGGIGFPVLHSLGHRLPRRVGRWLVRRRGAPDQLPLDTRVVLATSAALIVGGTVALAVLELRGALAPMTAGEGLLASAFTSVSARTAGFQTMDIGALDGATLLVLMGLMFIGGSPGSCAGGIKTTTLAVLAATMRAELVGRDPNLGGRAIAIETVRRAVAVVVLSAAIVFSCALALNVFEDQPFLALAFESVSAFGTVGLSTGITPSLGVAAEVVLMLAMFTGRLGPLTIALAVSRRRPVRYRLAHEELRIG